MTKPTPLTWVQLFESGQPTLQDGDGAADFRDYRGVADLLAMGAQDLDRVDEVAAMVDQIAQGQDAFGEPEVADPVCVADAKGEAGPWRARQSGS